jgi:hypothetical protein
MAAKAHGRVAQMAGLRVVKVALCVGVLATSAFAVQLAAAHPDGPSAAQADCSITQDRSLEGAVRSSIKFFNDTGETLDVYWLDYNGQRVRWVEMPGRVFFLVQTYLTHAWLVVDSAGACVGYTVSRSVSQDYHITGPRLTVTTHGPGTVTSAPAGISCGVICASAFLNNRLVTLTEGPRVDSFFAGWGGACTGLTPSCTVTLDAPKTVTATFTTPTLSLDRASFRAHWRKSAATGSLTISGNTSAGADAELLIGPAPGSAPIPLSLPVGAFTHTVPIRPGLLPGRHLVQLKGVSHGITIEPQQKTVQLNGPPEGVVSEAVMSKVEGGPPVTTVAPGAKELYARFRFAARPQPKCLNRKVKGTVRRVCEPRTITVTWFAPSGKPVAPPKKKANAQTVTTIVKANVPLEAGVWRVELRVDRILVMDAQATVPA